MAGKVYTLRPDVRYQKVSGKSKAEEKVSFREKMLETLETFLLVILFSLFLVASGGVIYKSFIYFKIKKEKEALLAEKTVLEERLKNLTSREIVLDKARKLGLRPPQEGDYIYLK
ncbi:MAG: hypothetical protein ABWJ99_04680 [Caldimicrobium sp.]